ncbi:MAG: DEAD/DEAH box helicase [Campylobacter sp.]|nr:DEAD/DEAH box helicase [Campylobacter sp.]
MQAKVYEYFSKKNDDEILICSDEKECVLASDALTFLGYECFVLPDFRAKFGDDLRVYHEEILSLTKELGKFHNSSSTKKLLITPARTILHKLPTKRHLQTKTLSFGDKIKLDELKDEILRFGYEFVDIVLDRGEVSFRGEVIDIFPVSADTPFRVLLFDDEIESIRVFNPADQISDKTELESLSITPFIAALSSSEYEATTQKISSMQTDALVSDINSLGFWAIDDFVDYLDEFKAICLNKFELDDEWDFKRLNAMSNLPEAKIYKDLNATFSADLVRLNAAKKITVISPNESLFASYQIENEVNLIISPLILNIYSTDEIIISLNKTHKKRKAKKPTLAIDELNRGDYVVHKDYGIGKFLGLELISVLGAKQEFIAIEYQNSDKLLLPAQNLYLIDKYVSNTEVAVLDRLGKGSFAKIKEKVRQKLFIIASKIIQLAAKRELIKGKQIDINYALMAKFQSDSGFEYTKDQTLAINEILKDISGTKVMDRLLSGDVGFGKTEVAMNALFATIKSGYQALFFVPTTLLSAQHYQSLKERFDRYDIPVFRLDRFTSTKEKTALKKALENKEPLVCVGTHSLLNLKATNLGLIIIDEEHKFGVKQKEKLKDLSSNSHLLTMSATPIPRSLNMALSSIKTYSTLKTPPQDRLEVKTFVKAYDSKIVKEAIMRELRRGGQIFYVHNKIADMQGVKDELLSILPNLRILILHSKIDAKTTEDELIKFMAKEYDLMLCTSIVESGIHMPRVNTILIDSADRFGIADLHQLRGRVGRSSIQGYCYYFIKDRDSLSKDALKRLLAIESNSALGSGALLAYHDLEIRGGGNLVGEAQSGHIEAIGYSLYLRMLEDEINKLLNKTTASNQSVELRLEISAYLSSELIPSDRLRLELYRRLSRANNMAEIYEISGEIEDRFGKLDRYTKQFIGVIMVKTLANQLNLKMISSSGVNISITGNDDKKELIKAKSKDDDDVLDMLLSYLRKRSENAR